MNWEEVPYLLHLKSILSSAKLVSSLTIYGIQSLSIKVLSLREIDFHCSSILEDTILTDSVKVPRLLDELTALSSVDVRLVSRPGKSGRDEREMVPLFPGTSRH